MFVARTRQHAGPFKMTLEIAVKFFGKCFLSRSKVQHIIIKKYAVPQGFLVRQGVDRYIGNGVEA